MLQGHGDDITSNVEINFSSNVWYGAKNFWLQEHLNRHFHLVARYPEILPAELSKQITEFHQLPEGTVLITNGATEAIYLLAQTYQGSNSTIIYPTFSEYGDACNLYQHHIHFIAESAFPDVELPKNGIIFICNPNNPTGKAYHTSLIENLIESNPGLHFIIDESYASFTQIPCSSEHLIQKYSNITIIKSLTKGFAIPGLRLGYILSNTEVIDKILKYKIPWSVNAFAIEAGKYFFTHWDDYTILINKWLNETAWLREQISAIPGFASYPSDTSFFLCTTHNGDAAQLKSYLLNEFGYLIRDASNFKGLNSSYFRLCTQMHSDNTKLTEALKKWNTLF